MAPTPGLPWRQTILGPKTLQPSQWLLQWEPQVVFGQRAGAAIMVTAKTLRGCGLCPAASAPQSGAPPQGVSSHSGCTFIVAKDTFQELLPGRGGPPRTPLVGGVHCVDSDQ